MKKTILSIALAFATFTQMNAHKLTIKLSGIDNEKGQIGIVVFSKDRYMDYKNPAWATLTKPQMGEMIIETNLPNGEYAIMVMHDENKNMTVDFDRNGVPTEATGMSNNPELKGFPKFEEIGFALNGDKTVEIMMVRYQ